ncbi:hypothetical protein SARC_07253 [Sphaeroforma arctica JP610]|uniref:Phospholipid/glycerol acyltransferase domain-containing protein n=1 Tax=Sphaeroforma arctica JP610 TaxID=667725 RepID=A0A0L0FUZ5_9EUKA|nr:hypothetical protein SARC_07253 [Sphaeroforma arctica JP610]KNC80386.1 hypothetical protein SARC_07253 [Sphaeroforma arctica JP610]|eukprot:XP_014154288.1 hypothetical protein SARC_07253 [Sphaeroforma arctica JP610]
MQFADRRPFYEKAFHAVWRQVCLLYHFVSVNLVHFFENYMPGPLQGFFNFFAPDIVWAAQMYTRRSTSVTAKLVNYGRLKMAVMNSQPVQDAINFDMTQSSGRRFSLPNDYDHGNKRGKREAKALHLLSQMATKPSMLPIVFAGYLLRKAFRLLYKFGINVDEEEIVKVRLLAKKHPLVFLPTHKSHLDYLIILYVCFVHDLPMPAVVAGDNLNMPFIGWLLRHCGAFFIRRSFAGDNDPLYGAIFREYLKQLLMHGHSLEMFIEGGRSRNGKVLMPKTGALQSVIGAVMESELDVMIVPIALSFDRIVETQSHLNELSGKPKQAEQLFFSLFSISSVMTSAATQSNTYGSVDLRFAEPISIRKFINEGEGKLPPLTKGADIYNNMVDPEARGYHSVTPPSSDEGSKDNKVTLQQTKRSLRNQKSLVTEKWPYLSYEGEHDTDKAKYLAFRLGYRVLYECNDVSVVLPASLLATVLLSQHQRGIYRDELISKVYWLQSEIHKRGGRVIPLTTDTIDMTVTLVLGGFGGANELVKTHNDRVLLSLYNPEERMELSTYRNQLVHHFIRESIMCCCIYALEKQAPTDTEGGPSFVDYMDLYALNRYLTQLLKMEFVFRPSMGVGINEHFDLTLTEMVDRGIIAYHPEDQNKICVSEAVEDGEMKGTLTYLFLCSIAWPFIDTYWLCTLGLFALLPNKAIQEDVLIRKMQDFGETLYFSGAMDLYESISKVTLENALQLLNKWRVISILRVEGSSSKKRAVQLRPEYCSAEKIQELVFQIANFRKKSRMYRSRQFRVQHHHEVWDAINTVKTLCKKSKSGSQSLPASPITNKKALHI